MNKSKILALTGILMFVLSLACISAVSIKDVSSVPGEVSPGETISVSIEVENIFEYDVEKLTVKLDLSETIPFAPYQSSSEKFLDELNEGDEEKFTFKLIALPSAEAGIYKIPVIITYENGAGNESIKQELISLTVNSKPELRVSLEDSVVLVKGKENTFSIKIINSGLSDVKFVYLSVSDTGGVKILSEKEQYIGDIDSDDFDSAKFRVYIDDNTLGVVNLPVIIKFKDATNKGFTETETVTLRTYSLKDAQNLGLVKKPNYTVYLIIAGVLVIYLIYRWRKKRKLKKSRS